eukprot:CAMPEP_0181417638 /NCGR_PEP_ID=MMETSP1110-20121109/11144_1 /TAXON_ID=174948 /ORGANISM="Symbiodinium sp., Strain CCMP421" /LENGTH=148 /DNA_ID=CAMNT_0023540595 /DNA_START=168 /DNA_END=611 /DNA_ORIENTATION=-
MVSMVSTSLTAQSSALSKAVSLASALTTSASGSTSSLSGTVLAKLSKRCCKWGGRILARTGDVLGAVVAAMFESSCNSQGASEVVLSSNSQGAAEKVVLSEGASVKFQRPSMLSKASAFSWLSWLQVRTSWRPESGDTSKSLCNNASE